MDWSAWRPTAHNIATQPDWFNMATTLDRIIDSIPGTRLMAMEPEELSELHALLQPRVNKLHAQGRYAEAERLDAVCLDLETELRERAPRTAIVRDLYGLGRPDERSLAAFVLGLHLCEPLAMDDVFRVLGSEG